tara:strand:+ start:148 stop:597 length:450 start_codon:yes stop_codon:yes gene_type:complete
MLVTIFFRIRALIKAIPFMKPLLYPIYRFIGLLYSAQIPLQASFQDQPNFKHGLFGIFIAGGAKFGTNCTFFQQVTIGSVTDGGLRNGSPEVGDNCIFFAGCKVIGRVKIGNNCKIGPNVVVWEDIPDGTTIVHDRQAFRRLPSETKKI